MATKRKARGDSIVNGSSPSTAAKRSRHNDTRGEKQRRNDNIYGQTSAIPGLDEEDDNAGDDATREALAYLRMVRSEALGIPGLLVAPKRTTADDEFDDSTDDSTMEDTRGYYDDGAYIAAPRIGPILPPGFQVRTDAENRTDGMSAAADVSPQEAFTKRILSLFRAQRASLEAIPPKIARQSLAKDTPTRLPPSKPYDYFLFLVRTFEPKSAHLVALDQPTVLKMLVQARTRMKRRQNVDTRLSEWIWGLFCRLNDVGALDSEAVSVVRELGKKAVWVGVGFLGGESANATEHYEDVEAEADEELEAEGGEEVLDSTEEDEDTDAQPSTDVASREVLEAPQHRRRNTSSPSLPDFDVNPLALNHRLGSPSQGIPGASNQERDTKQLSNLAAAKSRLLDRIGNQPLIEDEPSCPDANTRATIDMIITIAGEIYGQRDLLEFREVWGGEMGLWG